MQKTLCLSTLGDLDSGFAAAIIDKEIRTVLDDLDDRGDDGKARKVEISLTVQRLDNGLIAAHVEANARMPRRRTNGTIGRLRREEDRSRLLFQDGDSGNPDQRTLDEMNPESFHRKENGSC